MAETLVRLRLRNDTAANWTSANPILAQGELGVENDTRKFKFGTGATAWNALAYAGGSGGAAVWGGIGGDIADQPDLQDALDAKAAVGAPAAAVAAHIAAVDPHGDRDYVDDQLANYVETAEVGVSVAPLVAGLVPAIHLPSYVDDVLEYANFAAFPGTGETGKIYVALDTGRQWRWTGSAYLQMVASPGTTDDVAEGSSNLYHTAARVRAVVLSGLSLASSAAVTAADSVLSAFGKLQAKLDTLGTAAFTAIGAYATAAQGSTADTAVQPGRTISAAGLATGGGDLSANRTLTVTAASAGDVTTGTSATVAVTPGSLGPVTTAGRALNAAADATAQRVLLSVNNVDNTSDTNKPVSTAQAAADTAVGSAAATDATTKANAAQAYAIQRANHTGGQDAATITSGTIDIARLPAGALERLISVADEAARFALTAATVQTGDTVQQLDTGILYRVVDDTELDNAAGYVAYTAAAASSVPWSGVTGKPATITDVAAITGNNDDVVQKIAGTWVNRSMAQFKVTLAVVAADISDFAATVRGTLLTGLSTAAGTVVTSAHTILEAIGFLQNQVTARTEKATLTTKGDIYVASAASTPARLPVGATNGMVLEVASGEATGVRYVLPITCLIVACSDETTALTASADKVKFRMPYAFTLTNVRGSLVTAQTSGGAVTVDIHESGTTILSTKLTFDNTEKTTTTAATPAVISDAALADDAEISVDIDSLGDGTAKGLKVMLIGYRTP